MHENAKVLPLNGLVCLTLWAGYCENGSEYFSSIKTKGIWLGEWPLAFQYRLCSIQFHISLLTTCSKETQNSVPNGGP
jgi:hypothetical protein